MVQTEREYAEALISLAVEEASIPEYLDSLGTVKHLLLENPDYIEFLSSPAIALSERVASVDEAFGGRIAENVVSFLKVLLENGKMKTVLGCIDEFESLSRAFSNRTIATVYSVVELSDCQKDSVCKKLKTLTKKGIDPIYVIDKSLMGGIKIEVDGKTLDGSLKHRLGEIKEVMNS